MEGNRITTHLDRTIIESKLLDYNEKHYKKVISTNAYKDKIHDKLQYDKTRNKILSRTLNRDDCDNIEVFEFLQLLKNHNFSTNNTQHSPILDDE